MSKERAINHFVDPDRGFGFYSAFHFSLTLLPGIC